MAVELESLDIGIPRLTPGSDESEYHVTRHFTYFTKVVRNVRLMNDVYSRIKKNKDWGIDPDLVKLNPTFDAWIHDLPADLQITFPADGTPPWLPSHFIGNMHSYFHLSIIMLHRPQLTFMEPTAMDGGWKHHMMLCYSSAKLLCRLQEAILQSFGLTGLLSMQRGINFTIYCVLTCTVLHLVSQITRVSHKNVLTNIGCPHFAGSRSQRRRPRVLHTPHADSRKVYELVADARHAGAD